MRRPTRPAPSLLRANAGGLLSLVGIAIAAFAARLVPVLVGGGLDGIHGYDDGVYFGTAVALVEGVVPYRDFLMLHPPAITVLLSPFAIIGAYIGDAAAFALARVSFNVLGAVSAVLVALIAGRYGRLAGLTAGGLYALWNTAANGERSTDLHAPENVLLLIGLLALSRPGRIGPRRAVVVGVAIGLATAVQLWQAASLLVVLWWLVVRARGDRWQRLRPALLGLTGAALAFAAVTLPFFVTAPEAMIRYLLIDQVNRPSTGIDIVERLRVLEGLPESSQLPIRVLVVDPVILATAATGLAVIIATAWLRPWTRPWAVLALVQAAVVLSTPSFFNDYASFVAPAATLVFGTGLAAAASFLAARGRRRLVIVAGIALLSTLAVGSLARAEGERLPLADIKAAVSDAECISTDSPALLVLTSTLRRHLEAGCPLVLDPSGTSYDTDRGRLLPGRSSVARRQAPGYQAAMTEWYTSGDAALFVRLTADGLTPATWTAIERYLPVEQRHGPVTVRLPGR